MHTNQYFLGIAGRAAAFSFLMAGAVTLAHAQSAVVPFPAAQQTVLMAAAEAPAMDLTAPAGGYSSSSSDSSMDALAAERFDLSSAALGAKQPPPRRRYGKPNYSDSHTNPDGSNKWEFMVGAGITIPVSDTETYLTPHFAFQVGGGRNFNKKFGVLMQFDYNRFGFQGSTLTNQQALYNSFCSLAAAAAGLCTPITSLDGSSHVWSFTLNPKYTFYQGEKSGVYVVGGIGFYHKTANFTVPTVGTYCDPYYGCYAYAADQTIDDYVSNAVGYNGGIGITYKPSRFSGQRLYLETRYVFVDNSPRAASATNLYPPNANQTHYIPVTVGLQF